MFIATSSKNTPKGAWCEEASPKNKPPEKAFEVCCYPGEVLKGERGTLRLFSQCSTLTVDVAFKTLYQFTPTHSLSLKTHLREEERRGAQGGIENLKFKMLVFFDVKQNERDLLCWKEAYLKYQLYVIV